MTMHSAKGLEFDTVFVVGTEEGIFPSSRAIGETEEMEEERRLCYVAMTRAKRRLFMTCAQTRTLFGKTSAGLISRFVEEISDECIDKIKPASRFADRRFDESFYDEPEIAYHRPVPSRRVVPRTEPLHTALPDMSYVKGDNVTHKAFGKGVITDIKPTGGDALLEVEFESGKKRLMLKSAAAYMSKA
jgi:DNA helicase-2/ATP-dependent DNA helicase PcrA